MEEAKLSTCMTLVEKKISENLKHMDLKRDRFRQSILTLSASWKDFKDNLEKTFEEGAIALDAREDDGLNLLLNSIAESKEEVELLKNSAESFREELQQSEATFSIHKQEQMECFRTRERLLEDMFDKFSCSVQNWIKEVDLKQEELESKSKHTMNEFESAQESIERMKGDYKSRYKELENLQDMVEKRLNKLNDEEKQFEGRLEELLQKEKDVEVLEKLFAEDFNTKEKELEERSKELDLIQKQNEATRKEIELKIKELDLKKGKEVEVEMRQIKKTKRKEKSHVKVEKVDEMHLIDSSPASVSFTITMDGKNLQLFLNENSNDRDSMCQEVLKILQLSTDPPMLVLDAMEGFYPPHLSKGDKIFETSVVRNTCIILLQQLGKISPPIQSNAKERAFKLAEKWKNKINVTDCNSLEVFGLLHLLASYGLAADFGANDIIKYLNLVAEDDQVFELCRHPAFADKIPDLIKQFIEQSKFILAVIFICKLDLAHKFSPVPLLKDYIKTANNLGKGQKNDRDERITSLKKVVNCIVELNLQSEYPHENLQTCIEELLKETVDGEIESSISESQNRKEGSSSTVTNKKDECGKLKQSLSKKKRPVLPHHSHGSKRRFVSSAGESIHNPMMQFRASIRDYFPIATASQSSSSTYYRDPTGYIRPNQLLGRYGSGMASPHLHPFTDSAGRMRYGWRNENHFNSYYDGRRY